jgi:type III pantothenate kinase
VKFARSIFQCMNLVVDIGNSYIKIFVFDTNKLIQFQKIKSNEIIQNLEVIKNIPNLKRAIISSVGDISNELITILKNNSLDFIILDHHTPIPVKNLYKTPETLGKDRLAAIVGAYNIYKHQNVLAIDAGTAIKFDLINTEAEYFGGNISPGLEMRFRALNYFTKKLPLLGKKENIPFIGTSTEEAIIAGVQNGLVFEIDAYINKLREDFVDLKVILTGGDTFFFEHKLKNTIFAEPNLVAIGLNYILQYNVEKNN